MNKNILNLILLTTTLVAFSAPSIKYISHFFRLSQRWFFAFILLAFVIYFIGIIKKLKLKEFFFFSVFIAWIFLSVFWSLEADLSFYKGVSFLLVSVSCYLAAYKWVLVNPIDKSLDFMIPIIFLAFLTGIIGLFDKSLVIRNQSSFSYVYSGISTNSNYLGALTVISTPVGFWKIINAKKQWHKIFWWIITLSVVITCFSTVSRTSIVSEIGVIFFCFLAFNQNKKIIFLTSLITLLMLSWIFSGDFAKIVVDRYFLEVDSNTLTEGYGGFGPLNSRILPLTESYNAAKEGGLFGLGLGVSYGATRDPGQSKFRTFGYGREKSSSILAFVEELGIFGTSLYFIFLLNVLFLFLEAFKSAKKNEVKLLYIYVGNITGLFLISIAEAYWVAPGSMEFPMWYTLLGGSMGLSRKLISTKQLKLKENN